MSTQPREWWVSSPPDDDDLDEECMVSTTGGYYGDSSLDIHVIEKSAFDSLAAENEKLKAQLETLHSFGSYKVDELVEENLRLKAELATEVPVVTKYVKVRDEEELLEAQGYIEEQDHKISKLEAELEQANETIASSESAIRLLSDYDRLAKLEDALWKIAENDTDAVRKYGQPFRIARAALDGEKK